MWRQLKIGLGRAGKAQGRLRIQEGSSYFGNSLHSKSPGDRQTRVHSKASKARKLRSHRAPPSNFSGLWPLCRKWTAAEEEARCGHCKNNNRKWTSGGVGGQFVVLLCPTRMSALMRELDKLPEAPRAGL